MSRRIEIDRDLCIGSANCTRLARGVFSLDDDDVAVLVDPDAADAAAIRRAERSCPTGAISATFDPRDPP
jgi:ferredoxin